MKRQRVLLQDTPAQPWRNGGGSTRELLAWPVDVPWQVRVSVAAITSDGPFSSFPGIERWFAVLSGAGVVLDLPQGLREITCADAPLRFEGEAAPACRLIDGPTLDLNLMAQRTAGQPLMRRALALDQLDGNCRWRAVYAAEPAVLDTGDVGNGTESLASGTLLWSDASDASPWQLRSGGACWFMELRDE